MLKSDGQTRSYEMMFLGNEGKWAFVFKWNSADWALRIPGTWDFSNEMVLLHKELIIHFFTLWKVTLHFLILMQYNEILFLQVQSWSHQRASSKWPWQDGFLVIFSLLYIGAWVILYKLRDWWYCLRCVEGPQWKCMNCVFICDVCNYCSAHLQNRIISE